MARQSSEACYLELKPAQTCCAGQLLSTCSVFHLESQDFAGGFGSSLSIS